MPKCAICNSELRQIPAGVSKVSGKPYNAFWACPKRCPQPRQSSSSTSQEGDKVQSIVLLADEVSSLRNEIREFKNSFDKRMNDLASFFKEQMGMGGE